MGKPISMNQVCHTTLDVMKEASVSPAQDLYNYWHFRKITFNYEIKKNHYLDFLTSHPHMFADICVLCNTLTEQRRKKGWRPAVGGLLHHR